mgnify:CR=1 FL=1
MQECVSVTCEEALGLLMTYRCNLNCKYCYIHTKCNKDMSLEMAKSILEPFLMKKAGPVDITFMGGETLLAIDVIRPIVEWTKQNKWNRKYRFLGSTNGTLLNDELRQWLTDNKRYIILGLSYDGLPSAQIDNRGSDNVDVDFFIRTWPKQPIQMTINVDSVPQMAEGVIYLLEKGAVVHPNVAFEAYDWPEIKIQEYGRQLNILINYYNTHRGLPIISQFSHDLIEYASCIDNSQRQCGMCGVGNGLQVFDVDGRAYPCHLLSPLVLQGDKLQQIREGLITKVANFTDPRCTSCPYRLSCATCMGCNYIYRNEFNRRDSTHCKIMQVEVKAYIKKEIIRLKSKSRLDSYDAAIIDAIIRLIEYMNTNC